MESHLLWDEVHLVQVLLLFEYCACSLWTNLPGDEIMRARALTSRQRTVGQIVHVFQTGRNRIQLKLNKYCKNMVVVSTIVHKMIKVGVKALKQIRLS